MPKTIELTLEIAVQRVTCPGVWLCQDGYVSLTVSALGTNYQTCLLPPTFPLMFKDVFYFRKRFQESCALNNICCLLKEESIYCELLQWCERNASCECEILAQYLGALNDVLFPPNMCSNEGVDLLMRRSKDFPGILSPKIEIATKVRIDEVWTQPCDVEPLTGCKRVTSCHRSRREDHQRQIHQPACHSAKFHRSRDNSEELYAWRVDDDSTPKTVIESHYIEHDKGKNSRTRRIKKHLLPEISPCICEICKRYHELFHMNNKSG